jgi:hypothetical protein
VVILLPRQDGQDLRASSADARVQLDYNGIADPEAFEAKLQKAG